MTLASLFDFPFEQRRKLTWWSDMVMNMPGHGPVESWEQKGEAMFECFGAFQELWNQRVNAEPGNDLISMLAHNPATRNIPVIFITGKVDLGQKQPYDPEVADARCRAERQDHQEGRPGGHVVHLGQPR